MNKWEFVALATANKLAFLTSDEYKSRKDLLESMVVALQGKCCWALSCSSSLFFKGIVDDFNDFDILIHVDDVEIFKEEVEKLGIEILPTIQKSCFSSKYYREAKKGDVSFDLIGEITIDTFGTSYAYKMKPEDIDYITLEGGITVPIISAEANLLLYGMMEGWQVKRYKKRELCEQYLACNGLTHEDILVEASPVLPPFLKKITTRLLNEL